MAEFGPGGQRLWDEITAAHVLDAQQSVQLVEACRMKDRLDELDQIIRGRGVLDLMRFRLELDDILDNPQATVLVRFDAVLANANATANTMKQLLAALRLPDAATGKRPQRRGGGRGAYGTKGSAAEEAASRWGS